RRLLSQAKLSDSSIFLLAWPGFCLLFFSVSRSKLPGYVLPAFPAVALLLSIVLSKVARQKSLGSVLAGCCLLLFAGLLPLRLALHETSKIWPQVFHSYAAVLMALAAANGILALSELMRENLSAAHCLRGVSIVLVLLPVLFANRLISGFIVWDSSGRTLA